ncbi:methyltransferase domain-containing protein [Pantoea sp. BAV 3049]|uniref:methyltransferase domain-containing protein n=1 Tax=Pantoea sp. BAV 3049 TaxID=2654188 RepID=UPI00131D8CA9|nr:methyltransferase domain-containing protein [Pantoea sp. BAV 3049]
MKSFSDELQNGLIWLPELGMGYYPVPPERPYDENYFTRYKNMAKTPMGRELTAARVRLVQQHYSGPLVDVGVGAGQFINARPETFGYDVNPSGVKWLKKTSRWVDIYTGYHAALSFWDSLEHIDFPDKAVARAEKWVFLSIPVFENGDSILSSRHYRKNEHIWYFSHNGLIRWFGTLGFNCVAFNFIETELGREGIGSYVFERVTR